METKSYFCDWSRREDCSKTGCFYLGYGECFSTRCPQFALLDEDGTPCEIPYDELMIKLLKIIL